MIVLVTHREMLGELKTFVVDPGPFRDRAHAEAMRQRRPDKATVEIGERP